MALTGPDRGGWKNDAQPWALIGADVAVTRVTSNHGR
jgi:hypothetical protein